MFEKLIFIWKSIQIFKDFVTGSNINVGIREKKTLESQTGSFFVSLKKIVDCEISACENQVAGKNFDDKFQKVVDNSVKTFESRMHDAILTAMDKVVNPRVDMAVKLIAGSSEHEPISTV